MRPLALALVTAGAACATLATSASSRWGDEPGSPLPLNSSETLLALPLASAAWLASPSLASLEVARLLPRPRRLATPADSTQTCDFYDGSLVQAPPFVFYTLEKAVVPPVRDDATGLCVYTGASCVEGQHVRGFSCCNRRPGSDSTILGLNPAMLNLIACLLTLSLPMQIYQCCQQCKAGRQQAAVPDRTQVPCWVTAIFYIIMSVDVWLMITYADMTQAGLTVPVRNAMVAAGVFLTPVAEVFQFIEDVVTVKINAAVGAKDFATVREVLIIGVVGGMAAGVLAATFISFLCLCSPMMRFLLAPFSLTPGWSEHSAKCPLVPQEEDVVHTALPFVLLSAWTWPFRFTNMALTGFLISVGYFRMYFLLAMLEKGIAIIGLFVFFASRPSLLILGWIGFTCSVVATLGTVVALAFQKPLRDLIKHSRVGELHPARADTVTTVPAFHASASHSSLSVMDWADTAKEGLIAMVADVAVQIPQTVGVYMAGVKLGVGAMYQISALQAAFPQYGIAWVQGLALVFRIIGSTQLGAGDFHGFAQFFTVVVAYVCMLTVTCLATTLPFSKMISFDLAGQACEYASSSGCLPIYASIFGGGNYAGDSLEGSSFAVFIPALCAACFYRTFKAGLYACQDFNYMARAGLLSLAFVFTPSAIFASYSRPDAATVFAAMYLPSLVLAFAFAARTCGNIRRMRRGVAGPWNMDGRQTDTSGPDSSSESDGATEASGER